MINEFIRNYSKGRGRKQSEVLFRQLPRKTEETQMNFSKGRWSPDLNMRAHVPSTKEDVRCEVGVMSYRR
jgi:hypothetical protein